MDLLQINFVDLSKQTSFIVVKKKGQTDGQFNYVVTFSGFDHVSFT